MPVAHRGLLFQPLKPPMKRFTETDKWKDPWFRKLPMVAKTFWQYACDNCDHAGVLEPDWEAMSFYFGVDVDESVLAHFERQIEHLPCGKLLIVGFVQFQYGKLSQECKPHAPVFAALKRHGLSSERLSQNEHYRGKVEKYLRDKIIERDGPVCAYTGKSLEAWEIEIDHIHPRSKGGRAEPTNLVVADISMNAKKSDMSLDEFIASEGLEPNAVKERIRLRIGKPIKGFPKAFEKVQEKEKEKEEDKDSEREYAREAGGWPERIVSAYVRRDSPAECMAAVRSAIETGESAEEILQSVREISALCNAAPGGASNQFVPRAKTFFEGGQWRSPEAFKNRWSDAKGKAPSPPTYRYAIAQPDDEPEMNFAAIVEERQRKEREEIEEWHRQAGGVNAA